VQQWINDVAVPRTARKSWYRGGFLTDLKLRYLFPLVDSSAPTGVIYRNL
jgi:hypothetical protein